MKAVIIQHESSTPPGTTLKWLTQKNIPFEVFKLYEQPTLPALEDFDLCFICGGSMNVDQEQVFSWLKTEKNLLKSAIQQGKFLVGLCLGGQLLAEALGASVKRHTNTEVGWQKVRFLQNNFIQSPAEISVFQWHSYTFDTPEWAQRLASNEACQDQAFSYGKNVLGFQFHPESSKEWILECANDPELPLGPYCQNRDEIIRNMELQTTLENWYFSTLDQQLKNWQTS